MKSRGRNEQRVDIYKLARSWLADATHGSWVVILDNADDASILLTKHAARPGVSTTTSLLDCIPTCDHGSVLFTTRSQDEALRLVEYDDGINVRPMSENEAGELVMKKLDPRTHKSTVEELASLLDYMPLALTQAAAYTRRRGQRSPVRKYVEELRASQLLELNLLDHDYTNHRRDKEAESLIFQMWQI